MARAHRPSMTAGVVVCLFSSQLNGALFASEANSSSIATAVPAVPSTGWSAPATHAAVASANGIEANGIDKSSLAMIGVLSTSAARGEGGARLMFDMPGISLNAVDGRPGRVSRPFRLEPFEVAVTAGQVYRRPPYPYPYSRVGRDGAVAAILIGAAAAILGTAVLVYANRPECSTNAAAGGCGYGTKVVGTSVLAGGVVGLFVGALTWR